MAPAFLQEPKAQISRNVITRLVRMHRHDLSQQAIAVSLYLFVSRNKKPAVAGLGVSGFTRPKVFFRIA